MREIKISAKKKMIILIGGLIMIAFLLINGKLTGERNDRETLNLIANEELLILAAGNSSEGIAEYEVYTDKGLYEIVPEIHPEQYLFQSVQAVIEEGKIVHISNILEREVKLENCLVLENSSESVTLFSEGFQIVIPSKNLQEKFSDEIVDLYLTNGIITKISTKKERLQGKVLSVRNDGIEVEGYGLIPLDENFRFYETYGNRKECTVNGVIVGYSDVELVVAEGEICAALLEQAIEVEKIRVLLKTTDFADLIHSEITLIAKGDYEIVCGTESGKLSSGEVLVIEPGHDYLKNGRIILKPLSENARLEVSSIQRNYGKPSYAGTMEIAKESGGLILVNEIDLETYLHSVVPSEMPAGFELEALKAQAVCARSYAYRQILQNSYAAYGAHVDDSVSFQVYNNLPTDEKVLRAVNETAGQVLTFQDEVAETYYYSTSCGYTTNETIWKDGTLDHTYLTGRLLNDSAEKLDLQKEDVFREFILNETYETYDSGESWYRWELTVPIDQLTENVKSMKDVGKVTDIKITERNEGGVAQKLVVTGETGSVEICYEYAIRSVLNGSGQMIRRVHGSDAAASSLLPSAFIVIDPVEEEGVLTGYRIRGGGFGHGAGMSQNGANNMAEKGKTYREILGLFYPGAELEHIEDY